MYIPPKNVFEGVRRRLKMVQKFENVSSVATVYDFPHGPLSCILLTGRSKGMFWV